MSAHGYTFLRCEKEKKSITWARLRLFTVVKSVSSLGADTKTQSQWGPGILPRVHCGVDQIVSWYIPCLLEGLLGAKNVV